MDICTFVLILDSEEKFSWKKKKNIYKEGEVRVPSNTRTVVLHCSIEKQTEMNKPELPGQILTTLRF